MTFHDFDVVKPGAFVFSVTSSDDELLMADQQDIDIEETASPHISRIRTEDSYLYLANSGNAVNFLHGGVVGSFIYLVQAELIHGIGHLGALPPERRTIVSSLPDRDRKRIAGCWIRHFADRRESLRYRR